MKKIFIAAILLPTLIYAQSFQIKQVTNLPEDCRNIVRSYPSFSPSSYYAFESHLGNSSTINLGTYNPDNDSFTIITNVTNDNFININPQLIYSDSGLYIIYQTNRNGNWDVAYNIYKNNQLSPVNYIANSSDDETNPVVQVHYMVFAPMNNYVLYRKNGSIYFKDLSLPKDDAVEVFKGADSVYYSQPTISYIYSLYRYGYAIAAKKSTNGKPSLVIKMQGTNGWGEENVIADSGNVDSPEFQIDDLTYNNDLGGKKNIYDLNDFSNLRSYDKFILNPDADYFNYKTDDINIIFDKAKSRNLLIGSLSYQVMRNDSMFVFLKVFNPNSGYLDTLVFTNVRDSKLNLGFLGYCKDGAVYYTFWEDSLNGHITILGQKSVDPLGDIKDKVSPNTFSLEQNYPNPFNPSTTISVNLVSRSHVKLAVYDITGREVCLLMNEEKMPGRYTVNFDTHKYNLPSGIYFYRLTSGLNSLVKKMVLLK